ncbi:MAG: RsmB/NOP family class I SAM-dependent RNA methyltransferase, partial [Clostridia bacterium]|nr:RsmB/NOP family class I SAM-dependent RNA methyltransferase [Clostridia bacterium]
LQVRRGERVLDMCSAPGGKGTQLAQNMCGEGIIVLNEVNFSRAKILSKNVERMGVTNAAVISESPATIAQHFTGYFDKVLVDAPCSGEGMFLKENGAVSEWSLENVAACAKRQSLILDSAQSVLKPDGLLVYSTCTFAPEEDEIQIENFLKKYPNFTLLSMKKLYPHECAGEGHFVALLKKTDGVERRIQPFKTVSPDKKTLALFNRFSDDSLKGRRFENLHAAGEMLYSVMPDCPSLPFKTLRAGIRLCEVKAGRVEPCHALAMCLGKGETSALEVDESTAISYLGGNTFACSESLSGWAAVTYLGYPLGWCKAVNGIAKNHLPKGLRI